MQKSLCFFAYLVSSLFYTDGLLCSSATQPARPLVKVIKDLRTHVNSKKKLSKRQKAAAVVAGFAATSCSKPLARMINPNSITRGGSSLSQYMIMLVIGGGLTAAAVYAFIGNEMQVIINFKSTLKKLSEQIDDWHVIIEEMQKVQTVQEKKVLEAQEQIEHMLPLMQSLVQQSSNEVVLAQTVQHLYVECAGMIDRIKTLETILAKAAALDPKSKEKKAIINKLVKKSDEVFGTQAEAKEAAKRNKWFYSDALEDFLGYT